jgi:hypothetical protein
MEVLMRHITEAPKPPSTFLEGFDANLEAIILKSLEKEPARRYPDVRALRAALRELVDDDWASTSGQMRRVVIRTMPTAADFAKNTQDALSLIVTADERSKGIALQALGEALRTAVCEANVRLARELLTWLDDRQADPGLRNEERDQLECAILVVRDPAAVAAFVEQLLTGKLAKPDEAAPILVIAGSVAARALLEARRAQPPSLELRARFVSYLRATGAGALPVILGGLEPLTGLASRSEEVLADDLLRAAPDVRSDIGGELTVRFVRPERPALAVAALDATVRFWGPRAQALLLGVLDSTVDAVRIAAVEALRRLQLDDFTIDRLGRILLGQSPASVELRVAAASALAFAPVESHPRVVGFIEERLLRQTQGLVGSLFNKAFGPKEDPRVLVALARSLAALDPDGAKLVCEKLVGSRPELRGELESLLSRR